MNKKFTDKLEYFLSHECDDYDLKYDYVWDNDMDCCVVKISLDDDSRQCILYFKYDDVEDELDLEVAEDFYTSVSCLDSSVKEFWILVAPKVFA